MQTSVAGVAGQRLAYVRLHAAITAGDLSPGQRLVEADLAGEYGVPRNSLRMALDALIGEGLVERIPNRGARVRRVSTAEAIAITECRMALEGLIAAKAALHATDAEIAELRAQIRRMTEALAAGELLRYSELIQELHQLIRRAARQEVAGALIERLQAQIVRHQFRLSLRPGRPRISLAGLTALVEAIAARDADAAEAAARAHLRGVIAELAEDAGSPSCPPPPPFPET